MQFPLDIKAWHFEGSSSWCRNPELKSPMWDLDISLLGNILSNGDYLCFWVTYPEVSSWLHYISTPFTHFTVVSSSYLSYRKKKISAVLQVILIDSCYINNCNLGVPVKKYELKIFLLCYLVYTFYDKSFINIYSYAFLCKITVDIKSVDIYMYIFKSFLLDIKSIKKYIKWNSWNLRFLQEPILLQL